MEVFISVASVSTVKKVCHQIFELLRANYGRSLSEIGSIEVLDAPDSL
jgi:hypothetical protein